jgi:hypothetical protein
VLFHQWRQMTYRLPADKVVFEEDDAAAKALAASDGRYKTQAFLSAAQASAPNGTPRTLVAGNGPPLIWDDPLAPERGPEWDSFGTVFMHGLTSKGGTRRLVHIGLSVSDPPGASTIVSFRIMSNPPVTWDNLAQAPSTRSREHFMGLDTGQRLRLFAGQVDPADPSRFTIRYEAGQQKGMIDGQLQDDGTVKLAPRERKL